MISCIHKDAADVVVVRVGDQRFCFCIECWKIIAEVAVSDYVARAKADILSPLKRGGSTGTL